MSENFNQGRTQPSALSARLSSKSRGSPSQFKADDGEKRGV